MDLYETNGVYKAFRLVDSCSPFYYVCERAAVSSTIPTYYEKEQKKMSTHEKNIIKETIRTLAVIAKGNARGNETREQRKHARAFFRTLGKRVHLQDLIEREPITIRELERQDDAKDKIKFTESKLGVDCYAYSLPNDYNVLDDVVWELFGIRSDVFARQLEN